MDKNEEITIALATKLAEGMDARGAFDAVFGPGGYDNVAGMIYDALRANAS